MSTIFGSRGEGGLCTQIWLYFRNAIRNIVKSLQTLQNYDAEAQLKLCDIFIA